MNFLREEAKIKINERLSALSRFLKILNGLGKVTALELEANVAKRSIAERHLQLAAEVCIDTAEIIIAELHLKSPEDAREAIDILGQEGIIDDEFAFSFAGIGGFRNILVHDYN